MFLVVHINWDKGPKYLLEDMHNKMFRLVNQYLRKKKKFQRKAN